MASAKPTKEFREPYPDLIKPDAMLTRVIPNFIEYCNIDQRPKRGGFLTPRPASPRKNFPPARPGPARR